MSCLTNEIAVARCGVHRLHNGGIAQDSVGHMHWNATRHAVCARMHADKQLPSKIRGIDMWQKSLQAAAVFAHCESTAARKEHLKVYIG